MSFALILEIKLQIQQKLNSMVDNSKSSVVPIFKYSAINAFLKEISAPKRFLELKNPLY